ncbi:MAG: PD-(D/E)XK nuclease family protein, partial [Clostridiales bacterium]|nr:PD-(D/E)XK nuclease family protein [Clostridiales bacterium]
IIVNSLRAIFENIITESRGDFSSLDFIESEASAFEMFAETFSENSAFSQSLKKYFENDGRYLSVKLLFENSSVNISDEKKATELFGTDMYLSASRLEDYFNCRFRYFCKFGLLARPLQKADLNPMETGTVIHYVLENILSEIGSEKLGSMKSAQIHILVDKYLNNYFTTQLGNISDFTARFRSRFMRLSKMLYSVVSRLADEFSQSEFEACAFELKIDKDADVKPKVIELDNGTVQIRGSVDRVDMLEKNGEKYIRVVDYKSGNKDFKLSDVLYGLNLQMFVYLFTVCSDKNSRYSGIPAGVLYMHAARSVYNLSREKTKEDMFRESDKEFKMKGIVLYDENHDILKSMEKDLSGKYIPVKATAKGGVKGCFASFEELGVISRKIENLIKQMGNELHKGIIDQNPVNGIGHEKTCEYCDYSDVCANRRIIDKNEMKQISDENVVELLKEE